MSSPFRPITHLRHVAMAVPDYSAAVDFYGNLWGLESVADDGDVSFWGTPADPEQYVVRLRKYDADQTHRPDLARGTVGRRCRPTGRDLGARRRAYRSRAFGAHDSRRRVRRAVLRSDGILVEVSADVAARPHRELDERESIPKKLSHVVINSPDPVVSSQFYSDHLGLKVTDWLGPVMCFMRSGTQHHIVGFGRGPHASLNHVSFEIRGVEEFIRGSGRVMRAGHRPLWGPGRHGPGDNTFCYFRDPNGNIAEYTNAAGRLSTKIIGRGRSAWHRRRRISGARLGRSLKR